MLGLDGSTVVVSSGAEIVAETLFEIATMLPELVAEIVSDRVVLIINELDELERIVLEVDKFGVVLDVLIVDDEDEDDDDDADADADVVVVVEREDDDVVVVVEVEMEMELERSDELAALD